MLLESASTGRGSLRAADLGLLLLTIGSHAYLVDLLLFDVALNTDRLLLLPGVMSEGYLIGCGSLFYLGDFCCSSGFCAWNGNAEKSSAAAAECVWSAHAKRFEPCVDRVFMCDPLPVFVTMLWIVTCWFYYSSDHSCTMLQLASGLNSLIADAVSVVFFPRSFCSNTPS